MNQRSLQGLIVFHGLEFTSLPFIEYTMVIAFAARP